MTNPFNILVVEDEALFANKLEMQIDKLGHTLIGVVDNSDAALELVETHHVDLILMDIFIEGKYDGIELAEMIQKRKDIAILYITSQQDNMSFKRASRTDPVGYLLKPFSDIQLQRSIELALDKIEPGEIEEPDKVEQNPIKTDGLFIRKNQKIFNVNFEDIFYLKSDGKYCRIHTEEGMYLIRSSMKDIIERLPKETFIKCHRSYLVNLRKVKTVDLENDYVILQEMKVPLSRREKDNLLNKLNFLL